MKHIEDDLKQTQSFMPKTALPANFKANVLAKLDDSKRKQSLIGRIKGVIPMKLQTKAAIMSLSIIAVSGIGVSTYAVISNWPIKTVGETTLVKTLPNGTRIVKTTGLPETCGWYRANDGNVYTALRANDNETLEEFDAAHREGCDIKITGEYMESVLTENISDKNKKDHNYGTSNGVIDNIKGNVISFKDLNSEHVQYPSVHFYKNASVYENGQKTDKHISDLKSGDKIFFITKDITSEGLNGESRSANNVLAVYVLPSDASLPSDAYAKGNGAKKDASTDPTTEPQIPVAPDANAPYGYKVVYEYQGSL